MVGVVEMVGVMGVMGVMGMMGAGQTGRTGRTGRTCQTGQTGPLTAAGRGYLRRGAMRSGFLARKSAHDLGPLAIAGFPVS